MNKKERERQIRRYMERPKPVGGLLVFFWLGIPLLVALWRLLWNRLKRSRFTDHDIDELVAAAMARGRGMAEQNLFGMRANRADVEAMVELCVPYLRRDAPTPAVPRQDMVGRRGKDGRLRFGAYQFVYLYPTMDYLSVFTTQYNLFTDLPDEHGQAREHPYRHIVSIESGPRFAEFRESHSRKERSLVVGHWFSIVNSGGQRFEVGISYEDLDVALPGERVKSVIAKGQHVAGFEELEARLTDAEKRIRDVLRQKERASRADEPGKPQWGPVGGGSSPGPT